MAQPNTVHLLIVQTSAQCRSYQLIDADGKHVFTTRAYATNAGESGAIGRITAWARKAGYRVLDAETGAELVASPTPEEATRGQQIAAIRTGRH